jgi:hypothetical protein
VPATIYPITIGCFSLYENNHFPIIIALWFIAVVGRVLVAVVVN